MPSDQRVPFASYLLPSLSLPLRRRQQSNSSTVSDGSAPSLSYSPTASVSTSPSTSPPPYFISSYTTSAIGLLHEALQTHPKAESIREEGLTRAQPNTLKCITCASDIAFASQIVSKGFTGRHGRAYLVGPPPTPNYSLGKKQLKTSELVNTKTGRSVNRELLTGAHVVADVTCIVCQTVLGWKYVDAKEFAQRYKIGKFILETKRVVMNVSWEDGVVQDDINVEGLEEQGEEAVAFDSEDEDECEDIFAGVWDPDIVAKRRGRRIPRRKPAQVADA